MTVLDWEEAWKEKTAAPLIDVLTPRDSGQMTKYALSALESEVVLVATAPEGQRNDALNRAAYRLGRHVGSGYIDAGTVQQALRQAAQSAGLDEDEIGLVLRNDATSALTQGQANPREARPLQVVPEVTVLAEEHKDDPDRFSAIVHERFPLLDWHELWAREDTEEWIVEPILPARRLVALFSPPKVGKSLLMLEIAAAVARGTEILGTTPDRPRRVLYVDFENDPRGDIYERLVAMGLTPDVLGDLCYLSYPTLAKLDTPAGAAELMAIVAVNKCEVVVIDTISRAVQGEENENDTWLSFYRNTGLAMKQAGVACIRLDHTGKDQDKGMRGGSAKYGDVDAVWKLSSVGDDVTFKLDCTDHRLPIAEKNLVLKRLNSPYLHHMVDAAGRMAVMTALIEKAITELDEIDVDIHLGRDAARALLKAAGKKAGTDVLTEAIRQRRIRRNMTPDVIQ